MDILESYEDVLRRAGFEWFEPRIVLRDEIVRDTSFLSAWRYCSWYMFFLKKKDVFHPSLCVLMPTLVGNPMASGVLADWGSGC